MEERLLAARCGISEISSLQFPIKVRCEDVRDAKLQATSGEETLRGYVELIRAFQGGERPRGVVQH